MSDEQFREDELVSAYLDGEATPAEIAEVEQNDALMARVEQLRSVRDAVAAPVAPMPAERREQMISAALAVADAENAQRREARIVPIRRRRETLLAVAAAAILLAAVVSAGLIASRSGDESAEMAAATDDSADMAADAPAADAGVEATAAAPAEADMAMAEDSADYEMAAEPMPEEEPMAEQEPMAEEALAAAAAETEGTVDPEVVAELQAEMAAAEAESAMETPVEDAADAPTASAEEERRTADEAAVPVVDLGAFENLESLFDTVTARWSTALENGTTADSETCSAAVRERELELDVETGRPFVAAVGTEEPLVFDGRFARRSDGTAVIIYAAPPDCETETHDLDAPDGS
ncbi:MAG: hypothetical protein F4Y12_08725 [Acidimicrobiaceae bacterium]|nr:hypothetical protein [Acidimicrobiaceae bacterium]MYH78504.1 hypothetical protein [Acidimicrobiaceae bacterium]MYK75765.1 hypothetical protein [Acidimicrobiaceae bacterium]